MTYTKLHNSIYNTDPQWYVMLPHRFRSDYHSSSHSRGLTFLLREIQPSLGHSTPTPHFVVFLSALNQTGSLLTGHTTVRRHDTQIFTACVVKHPEAIQKESITVILVCRLFKTFSGNADFCQQTTRVQHVRFG